METDSLITYVHKLLGSNSIFDATNSALVVVDSDLHILYHNNERLKTEFGKLLCPGDLLRCINAVNCPDGCGTSSVCPHCDLRCSVNNSLQHMIPMMHTVILTRDDNKQMTLHTTITPFTYKEDSYAAVFLIEISEHIQMQMITRVFYHDMINLSNSLKSFMNILEQDPSEELFGEVKKLSNQIYDELAAQKELFYAQSGTLSAEMADIYLRDFLKLAERSILPMVEKARKKYTKDDERCDNVYIRTDSKLLHRVVMNMVKNASEATPVGHTFNILASVDEAGEYFTFSVHNEGVIPEDMRKNVFTFGNSTKGTNRGIGTYSMRLFGENYLHGKVWFTTDEKEGTTFYLRLPIDGVRRCEDLEGNTYRVEDHET